MKIVRYIAITVLACLAFANQAVATKITGAGATFPYPLYAKWAAAYKAETGHEMNYQSIGSGGGIKQIKSKTVDFGASDKPLSPDELTQSGLIQFPTVVGGAVPIVNIPGIAAGQLKLTGAVLADIFLGKINKWNHPAIVRLNKGLRLPNLAITVVHRADSSGTSFLFTHYLSKVSPRWRNTVGANDAVKWPTGLSGKGNEGVSSFVMRAKGAIGYVEYAYAKQNKIAHVALQNAAKQFVQPSVNSFRAAAANAKWSATNHFYVVLTNQPGKNSWPISGATFIFLHKKQVNATQGAQVLKFFDWCYLNGDAMAIGLDYVPIPKSTKDIVRNSWKTVTNTEGKSIR
ncbi:MAG: phosphate ABC transporter substrate-binding protein PstS [Neisseriales bacterium]|nr:MAG: phosphate ABC transporter substrate-binding protein PstS [Neisseriales bacterium]